ncbi:MAG: N-acetylmuramic acid 6-phosphate etherase [Raineya sp.]|nr:N-acetylmuramic acid 6-phosphate etherase [Raineya sp.]
MNFTEANSKYQDLEKKSIREILEGINAEDKTVPYAVEKAIPQIEKLVAEIVPRMQMGGRLFYIGAGTSGRLGIVDASECPPTFGVPHDWVIGLIAGGDSAIRKAVEFAEDDTQQAWRDLQAHHINQLDVLVGIAASGRTPYVVGGLQKAQENGVFTACITCNLNTPAAQYADIAIEIIVGPEFITGSTRMKAGTAQKLVLNMISTTTMIQLGRVKGNQMVDMQLANQKLIQRAIRILTTELNISAEEAQNLLQKYGNVRKALESYQKL